MRPRMIDDMTLRKLSPKTQAGYLRAVLRFTRFFGRSPNLASPEDLRAFQLYLVEQGVSSTTINATLTGLTFFFGVTLDRPSALKRMSRVRHRRSYPRSSASRRAKFNKISQESASLNEMKGRSVNANFWKRASIQLILFSYA